MIKSKKYIYIITKTSASNVTVVRLSILSKLKHAKSLINS